MRPQRVDGQAGGGDGLAVALVLFVGNVERDARRELRELDLQHLARAVDDVVAARAGGDAPEHEHVPEVVERGEMRDAIAEVRAERLVDLLARA